MKLISVIITAYNEEEYLLECLKSVQQQTYNILEIIFVDDGSNDHTLDIVNQFKDNTSLPIKIITGEHKGLANARNKGLEVAKGDYIKFLDGDDTLHPKALEKMLRTALRCQADVVKTSYNVLNRYYNFKNAFNVMNNHPYKGINISEHKDFIVLESVGMGNKLYKREILDGIYFPHFSNPLVPLDLAISPFILAKSNIIGVTGKNLVNFRNHADSLRNREKSDSTSYLNSLEALTYLENLFKEEDLYEDYKTTLNKLNLVYRFMDSINLIFKNNYPVSIKIAIFKRLQSLCYNTIKESLNNPQFYQNEYVWWYSIFSKIYSSLVKTLKTSETNEDLISEIKELHLKR